MTIVSPPASGSAVANADGTITYTPGAATGDVTFTYTVKDNLGIVSNTATVTVHVNAPPVAATTPPRPSRHVPSRSPCWPTTATPTAPSSPASVADRLAAASGSAVVNADGTITYTPGAATGRRHLHLHREDNRGMPRPTRPR